MTDERMPDRKRLLDQAAEYVLKQRNKTYGEPDEDFQRIAAIASAMGFRLTDGDKVRKLTGSDVSLFMIALKLSRLVWSPEHEDSWIDIAGYAACGMETANLEQSRKRERELQPVDLGFSSWDSQPVSEAKMLVFPDGCVGKHHYAYGCQFPPKAKEGEDAG